MDASATMFAFDAGDAHFRVDEMSASALEKTSASKNTVQENICALTGDTIETILNRAAEPNHNTSRVQSSPLQVDAKSSTVQDENKKGHAQETMISCDRILENNSLAKSTKKKRRNHKKQTSPALNTVRGFTPITSADEDSDFSPKTARGRTDPNSQRTPSLVRKDLQIDDLKPSANSSALRAASPSGISALSQQIDHLRSRSPSVRPTPQRSGSMLATSETTSSASITSDTDHDEDATRMTTYEVNIEHDFISSDISEKERRDMRQDPMFNGGVVRKMQATDFETLRCLGKGTYGTVFLVKQNDTGKLYAQKQFRKASLTVRKHLVEQTKTERSILESINRHPFVVKLFYAFQDHEKLYLILEYAQGGELFERMRAERMFPEETAAFYMAELVLALEHLHHNVGVIYRDLKPENCLLDSEGHLLLTDFGLSKVAVDGDYRCNSIIGTVEYMAPEVVLGRDYDTAVDWWSLGVLGFDLLTGSSPFQANNDLKIKQKIVKSKPTLPYFMSMDAKDLLTRLLRKEPKKRLGANMPKDMQTIKGHRFFRKIDWAKLERRELEPPIKPLITDPELAENFSEEFTNLALSPVTASAGFHTDLKPGEHDPFGGFSFVGSRSLLESDLGCF